MSCLGSGDTLDLECPPDDPWQWPFFSSLLFRSIYLITTSGVFQLTRCGLLWLAGRTFPTLSEPSGCPMLAWPLQDARCNAADQDSCAFVYNVCNM